MKWIGWIAVTFATEVQGLTFHSLSNITEWKIRMLPCFQKLLGAATQSETHHQPQPQLYFVLLKAISMLTC